MKAESYIKPLHFYKLVSSVWWLVTSQCHVYSSFSAVFLVSRATQVAAVMTTAVEKPTYAPHGILQAKRVVIY